jgi:hypothetical protein
MTTCSLVGGYQRLVGNHSSPMMEAACFSYTLVCTYQATQCLHDRITSTQKIQAACSNETLITTYQAVQYHNVEGHNPSLH